jgi:hypothetical protein
MKLENLNIQNAVAIAILAIVAYLLFLKPLFKKVSGNEDEETKKLKDVSKESTAKSGVAKAFDRLYFARIAKEKKKKPTELLKSFGYNASKLLELAKALYGAKGLINDDETLVYNVFASLPNLFVASALTFTFKETYKKDLQTYLQSFLNENEYNKLVKILNSKKPL